MIRHAPWAARSGHTSVADASGAIYLIGGYNGTGTRTDTYFNDVWVSTDGGAARTRAGGCSRRCSPGLMEVPRGT